MSLHLYVGLQNGVMIRSVVDEADGRLSDTRKRFLGARDIAAGLLEPAWAAYWQAPEPARASARASSRAGARRPLLRPWDARPLAIPSNSSQRPPSQKMGLYSFPTPKVPSLPLPLALAPGL